MSYIKVWKANDMSDDEGLVVAPVLRRDEAADYTDGEDIMAVRQILTLLDSLDNGEVIVIAKEVF